MTFKYFFFQPKHMETWTKYLFWLGVILAIIAAILPFTMQDYTATLEWIILIEVIIGILLGFFNIEAKEVTVLFLGGAAFLLAYPAFVKFTEGLSQLAGLWDFINMFLAAMAAMVAPAIVIVALKVLPAIMKD